MLIITGHQKTLCKVAIKKGGYFLMFDSSPLGFLFFHFCFTEESMLHS